MFYFGTAFFFLVIAFFFLLKNTTKKDWKRQASFYNSCDNAVIAKVAKNLCATIISLANGNGQSME
jgi:hypothetical protein